MVKFHMSVNQIRDALMVIGHDENMRGPAYEKKNS